MNLLAAFIETNMKKQETRLIAFWKLAVFTAIIIVFILGCFKLFQLVGAGYGHWRNGLVKDAVWESQMEHLYYWHHESDSIFDNGILLENY